MSELWVPGTPSADDFVTRIHQQIARFGETHGLEHVAAAQAARADSLF